jgi:hypothetical protein
MTLHAVAAAGEETTAYTVGSAIGKLLGLKRMIDLNMTDHSSNPEGMRGMMPMFSKDEVLNEVETVINKLNTITYPYKI